MSIETQIEEYLNSQPEPKRSELIELNNFILQIMPDCKLWFLDGKDAHGKTIANPNIGYGSCEIKYKNGDKKAQNRTKKLENRASPVADKDLMGKKNDG